MDLENMTVGERIGELAKIKNMSIRKLALSAGMPYTTLYSIVRRKSDRVDSEKLAKIANALGMDHTILFFGKAREVKMREKMNEDEYQQAAMRTAPWFPQDIYSDSLMINGVMGLAGESGECVDMVKKYLFQGHDLDKEHLAKELGDVAWYLAITARAIGYDLSTVLQMNVEKLKKRYPDGFTPENSIHRKAEDV